MIIRMGVMVWVDLSDEDGDANMNWLHDEKDLLHFVFAEIFRLQILKPFLPLVCFFLLF